LEKQLPGICQQLPKKRRDVALRSALKTLDVHGSRWDQKIAFLGVVETDKIY
jgi:hypothetical protein